MKKLIILTAMLLGISTAAASAANGDIVGDIYSTDIIAYVNGRAIPSYNIGGRTAIVVEDLEPEGANYGIGYWYDDDARKLTVYSYGSEGYGETHVERGTVGRVEGNILETDITVTYNGIPVTGYNIGGRTAVVIEDLGTVTEGKTNSEYGYSEYLCDFNWNEETREVSLNTFQGNDPRDIPVPKITYTIRDHEMTLSFDQLGYFMNHSDYDFSDDFPRNSLQPIYLDGEQVGLVYITDDDGEIRYNLVATQFDFDKIYPKSKELEVVLSYDEAVKFIEENYTVEDKIEMDSATVYMVKNDEGHNILYAMKNGGLVLESIYGFDYTTVEFTKQGGWYVRVSPFAGPHGATTMMTPVSPYLYDFNKTYYANFGGIVVENYDEIKEADARVTVDGEEYTVPAIKVDGKIYLDTDQMASICLSEYSYWDGRFIISTPDSESRAVTVELTDEREQDENGQVSYLKNSTLVINGENKGEADAYIYKKNNCYIAADFFIDLLK